jgi:carbon starvation protein
MALIAAATLEPGIYFAMNSPAAIIGTTAESAVQAISKWGFYVTPEMITQTAKDVGEHTIISRTGGAPTLAVGMAQILSGVVGGQAMMAFWYHFAILFEALFILTAVDAGTRAGRFMLQDLLGTFIPSMKHTGSLVASLVATGICVAGWGYFLYQGVIDPLGGINTLWPLFGIANQMLAGIALILCTCVLFKMKRDCYAWVTIIPAGWVITCTLTAAWQKIFDANPRIGFVAHASLYKEAVADGIVLAPAKSIAQMQQVILNDYVNASLAGMFMLVLISMLVFGVRTVVQARATGSPSAREAPFELLPADGGART